MRILRPFLTFLTGIVFTVSLGAQNKPAQCDLTCEPDPTSSSYTGTLRVRPQPRNARGRSTPLAAVAAGGIAASPTVAGSESYSYAFPILSLRGRAGLDLNLILYYNSQLWTIDSVNGTATFNADRDFPGYGFRLGFGYLEGPFTGASGSQTYLLTEADGTKRELRFSSGTVYVSFDSSYVDWNSGAKVLRRKNGMQWQYEQVGTSTIFRPIKIQDTNGNFVSISYSTIANISNQAIATITDSLGRIVAFNYDTTTHKLLSVTAPALGGGTQSVAGFTWGTAPLNYSFALGVNDTVQSGTLINVPTGLSYPNGTGYNFVYGDWGILKQITKSSATGQTRGYVLYDYPLATTALSDHPTFTTQTEFDGVNTGNWTHTVTKSGGLVSSFAITDPAGTTTTTYLYTSGWQTGLTSSVAVLSGATTLRTVAYNWTQDDPNASVALNPRTVRVTTTLNDSGQQSKVELDYTTNGNVSEVREFDYGLFLVRKIQMDYQTGQAYLNLHILDRSTQTRIYDGSGNPPQGRTDFAFDSTSPISASGASQHDDVNYGTNLTTRGNLTAITRYTNAAAGTGVIVRQFTFDILGNTRTAQVDCCQLRQWFFTSNTQYGYPETITSGPAGTQLSVQYTYDLATGLPLTTTDENQKTTSFGYDVLNRLVRVTRPDGAVVSTVYDDSSNLSVITATTPLNSTNRIVEATTKDGSGRVIKQETKNVAGTSYSITETQYDVLGRSIQTAKPHAPGETPAWTLTGYDALGRVLTVTSPGNAGSYQYAYLGNRVTLTDPAGKKRRTYTDALNRLVQTHEPGYADGAAGNGSVTIIGTEQWICDPQEPPPIGHPCSRIYDFGTVSVTVDTFTATVNYGQSSTPPSIAAALANQFNASSASPVTALASGATFNLTAKQAGAHTNYSLSGSSATNDPVDFGAPSFAASPSGPNMTGGADGTGADGSQPSIDTPLITVTNYNPLDNLTVATQGVQQRTFVYDGLGRLTTETTPEVGTVYYTYADFGQVLNRTDARGAVTNYTYDGLNRLKTVTYTIVAGVAPTPAVTYFYDEGGSAANALGRLTSRTDGVGSESYQFDVMGRVVQVTKSISGTYYLVGYAYNLAGQLTSITYPSGRQVTESYDSIGRVSQIATPGTNLLSNMSYNAAGFLTGFSYGNSVQGAVTYNGSLQLASLAYSNGTGQFFKLTYDYGTGNNGQIQNVTDIVDSTRSTTYAYDAWSRLKTAQNSQWGLSWDYDRFGNRKAQNVTAGSAPSNSVTASQNTNRIVDPSYGYDASGNMTADGLDALVYDAENRVSSNTQAGTTTYYSYDGNNSRVKKQVTGGTTTVYIFSGTKVIAEYENGALPAAPAREHVYSGNQLLATFEGGTTKYHHADHLSVRVSTDSTGNIVRTFGHFPFGEVWYETGVPSKWKFTTYERDAESGNDYAIFRYDVNRLGRFSSPDPVPGSVVNPQSLNRYAYVRNDPINLRDPDGRDPRDVHEFITFLMAALTGHAEAADIARGAGAADNFWNATTGLLGFGWIVNYDKHFGTPCSSIIQCMGDGPFRFGMNLHLVEDNAQGAPHNVGSWAHIFLNLIGRSPDNDLNKEMAGLQAAWAMLGGTADQWEKWGDVIKAIVSDRNETGLEMIGSQLYEDGKLVGSYGVGIEGAVYDHTEYVNGVEINFFVLGSLDPNIGLIQAMFSLPGSNPMEEAEALYYYQVYGVIVTGGFGCGCGFGDWLQFGGGRRRAAQGGIF